MVDEEPTPTSDQPRNAKEGGRTYPPATTPAPAAPPAATPPESNDKDK